MTGLIAGGGWPIAASSIYVLVARDDSILA